jgi:hypothetical protein
MFRGPGWSGSVTDLQPMAKRLRKRNFTWCRRPNRFSDNPRWRVVAKSTGIGLAAVIAFVNRLEELGNDAANRGDHRGSVAEFNAQEFAAALDISVEEVKALYACLEHSDIGWIADGVIADFQDRNPDQEDPTASERQRRRRSRTAIQKRLDELVAIGKLSRGEHAELQVKMAGLDHDGLIQLQMDIEKSVQNVTRDSRMSQRDSVTVTPDQKDQKITKDGDFTTTAGASGNIVGLAREEMIPDKTDSTVSQWFRDEAPKFVVQRMGGSLEAATRRLHGWCEQVGDAALFEVLQGTKDREGTAFHLEVADQVRRRATQLRPASAIGGPGG